MPTINERLELIELTLLQVMRRLEALEGYLASRASPASPNVTPSPASHVTHGDAQPASPKRTSAERMRRLRQRRQQSAEANDAADGASPPASRSVTCDAGDARHSVTVTQNTSPSHTLPQHTHLLLFEELELEERQIETESARAREQRGARLLAGMRLPEPWRLMARQLGADEWQIERWWAEFVDYWCAVPGQRGTKIDWPATWRNRVRRQLEQQERRDDRSLMAAGRRLLEAPGEFYRRLTQQLGAGEVDYIPQPAPLRVVSKG